MTSNVTIAIGQINSLVGDIHGNTQKIIQFAEQAKTEYAADLIVFPELALTGYPPEDLILREDFHQHIHQALEQITQSVMGIDMLLGYPLKQGEAIYNSASLLRQGEIIATYHKQYLPNYGVFDEKRYFTAGHQPCVVKVKDIAIGIIICEDGWHPEPAQQSVAAGAELLITINASPFDSNKCAIREQILSQRVQETQTPMIYVHNVGGQDEVVFDGHSLLINGNGDLQMVGAAFDEQLLPIEVQSEEQDEIQGHKSIRIFSPVQGDSLTLEAKVYKALVTATRDYVQKNRFQGVLLGLSGGIDSALTLAIAVDALGADKVHAVMMPSRYTADISLQDSQDMVNRLGVKYSVISIEPAFNALLESLADEFADYPVDVTEENMQARVRGNLLMALSNKTGKLVLTTGNKSEMAVGYATLYGDMCGGFAVLKDVYKTLVYRLAAYRNTLREVIPQRIITRPPSAELAPNQVDQDSLPEYAVLDDILERYVEHDQSQQQIIAAGFEIDTVNRVLNLVDRNEYKRRQAPPGVKITTRAFGRERRYPITSGFRQSLNG